MQTIYTIGTQGMNDKLFLRLLQEHEVDAVIDIRLRNEGKWHRFASGKHIKSLVESEGIAYVHETRFAPAREMLNAWRDRQDWPAYEAAYRDLMQRRDMPCFWREIAGTFSRPCLLCAEDRPDHCHRRLLAEHVANADQIIHLGR